MNKEVKFSRFVGIAIVLICIWIVVLALKSAITKNENNDNYIYVDEGSKLTLNIPKSNIISKYVDIQKEITKQNSIAYIKVKLPKINIGTNTATSINDKMYAIYQETYEKILNNDNIQKINIDYTYEYLDNDTIIKITIISKTTINNTVEEEESKYIYDLKNDKEIIE